MIASPDALMLIAFGVLLHGLWCRYVPKIRSYRQRKKTERRRATVQAEAEQLRIQRIAQAMADLSSSPFVIEARNDQEFIAKVRTVYSSLKASDSERFFNSPNGMEH